MARIVQNFGLFYIDIVQFECSQLTQLKSDTIISHETWMEEEQPIKPMSWKLAPFSGFIARAAMQLSVE
jgi:hypothetical protein